MLGDAKKRQRYDTLGHTPTYCAPSTSYTQRTDWAYVKNAHVRSTGRENLFEGFVARMARGQTRADTRLQMMLVFGLFGTFMAFDMAYDALWNSTNRRVRAPSPPCCKKGSRASERRARTLTCWVGGAAGVVADALPDASPTRRTRSSTWRRWRGLRRAWRVPHAVTFHETPSPSRAYPRPARRLPCRRQAHCPHYPLRNPTCRSCQRQTNPSARSYVSLLTHIPWLACEA